MTRRPFGPDEEATLRRMRDAGHSCPDIAAQLGRHPGVVYRKARALGVGSRGKEPRHRRPFTPADEHLIRSMRAAGTPWRDICAALDRHPGSVFRKAHDLGIPISRRRREPPARKSMPEIFAKRRADIRQMRADGLSLAEIGRRLGCTKQAVFSALKKGPASHD